VNREHLNRVGPRLVGLTPNQRLVYYGILHHANAEMQAWPSVPTLINFSGASRMTVLRALRHLETLGLIRTTRRTRANGSRASNVYQASIPDGGVSPTGTGGVPTNGTGGVPPTDTGGVPPTGTPLEDPFEDPFEDPIEDPLFSNQNLVAGGDVKPTIGDLQEEVKKGGSANNTKPLKISLEKGIRTPTGVEQIWNEAYPIDGFRPPFTMKEKGQAKNLLKKVGKDRVRSLLQRVLGNWENFSYYAQKANGAKDSPSVPHLGFVLANAVHALKYTEDSEPAPVVNIPEPVPVNPKYKVEELPTYTPEQWLAFLEDDADA
jgi:hypothetical protein